MLLCTTPLKKEMQGLCMLWTRFTCYLVDNEGRENNVLPSYEIFQNNPKHLSIIELVHFYDKILKDNYSAIKKQLNYVLCRDNEQDKCYVRGAFIHVDHHN